MKRFEKNPEVDRALRKMGFALGGDNQKKVSLTRFDLKEKYKVRRNEEILFRACVNIFNALHSARVSEYQWRILIGNWVRRLSHYSYFRRSILGIGGSAEYKFVGNETLHLGVDLVNTTGDVQSILFNSSEINKNYLSAVQCQLDLNKLVIDYR